MELTQRVAESFDSELLDPGTRKELGLVFTLRSPDDREVKVVEREWRNHVYNLKAKKNRSPSLDESEDYITRKIVAQVKGWRWTNDDLRFNGEQPDYTPAVLKDMMKQLPWVRDHLVEQIGEVENFFGSPHDDSGM